MSCCFPMNRLYDTGAKVMFFKQNAKYLSSFVMNVSFFLYFRQKNTSLTELLKSYSEAGDSFIIMFLSVTAIRFPRVA